MRIGEIADSRLPDSRENCIEFLVRDQEGEASQTEVHRIDGREVQPDSVTGRHGQERTPAHTHLQTEDVRQEFGGDPVIPGRNDGVIQLD